MQESDQVIEDWHRQVFGFATIVTLEVPWQTPPKHRHRTNEGRAYNPDADAEQATGTALMTQWKRPPMEGPFALTVVAYRKTRQKVDIDNLCKHVMDAGNGVLWKDDSQCAALLGFKLIDPTNPRTVIAVSSYPEET